MNAAKWNVVPLVGFLALAVVGVAARGTAAPQTAGEKPTNHVVQAKDAVVKGAKVVGEKTKDGLSKTGEVMTDGWITTRVHSRFVGEDLLKDSDIKVDTDKHVVTLKGTIDSQAKRQKAAQIASNVQGVRSVRNELVVISG